MQIGQALLYAEIMILADEPPWVKEGGYWIRQDMYISNMLIDADGLMSRSTCFIFFQANFDATKAELETVKTDNKRLECAMENLQKESAEVKETLTTTQSKSEALKTELEHKLETLKVCWVLRYSCK